MKIKDKPGIRHYCAIELIGVAAYGAITGELGKMTMPKESEEEEEDEEEENKDNGD